ncbi:MAG TPA: riboflavin synthase [Solirubrobacteraceae bacterium]|jgi:riboflavin synthase|nr:riboflavin synthase [Solirubrobacteraceae bacterium]
MFTGLIADLGRIEGVERSGDGVRLSVSSALTSQLAEGDSIAVNGVCLTATDVKPTAFATDVMNETLRLSSLADARAGSPVNLELAMRLSDRLGGHMVQGHVDGMGTVREIAADGFARRLEIEAGEEVLRYVVHKGSITVDGVSLTVAGLRDASFTVSLIPETLERTNLGHADVGTTVNLEVDVLAKYVERLVGAR